MDNDFSGHYERDAAVGTAMGARASGRVLVVRSAASARGALNRFADWLDEVGHFFSSVTSTEWETAFEGATPDLVILEIDTGREENAVELCRALRSQGTHFSILAVFPSHRALSTPLWPKLQDAGASDCILMNAERETFLSRVELLLRLAELELELEASHQRLMRQKQIDETTQLLNRRFFFHYSYREFMRARRHKYALSCLMIGMDYLEELNKKFGHGCRGHVLRTVADIVQDGLRESDIAGRFSERKFAVLLPETCIEEAVIVRERLMEAFENEECEWEGEPVPLCVSIGEAARDTTLFIAENGTDERRGEVAEKMEAPSLSVREELAALLEDADAALSVARRSSLCPEIFTPFVAGIE